MAETCCTNERVRKPEWKSRLFGRDSHRMENNIKIDFKEIV
jgi:hypothetical protein